jgi:hypothetical protein
MMRMRSFAEMILMVGWNAAMMNMEESKLKNAMAHKRNGINETRREERAGDAGNEDRVALLRGCELRPLDNVLPMRRTSTTEEG